LRQLHDQTWRRRRLALTRLLHIEMVEARHQRREKNLNMRQRTLLLERQEGVANCTREKSQCR
jgi:hypothetical protein